ncbi:hypothetical protein [Teredinibacter sp. KSP-S5-2]|uniref:hypothetical protein n=1 Tax=Teredinibacter sp. KSP-S5-2 TaxID=3034506 RepID=UPI002934761A|nr:hypothetical protein [Teredinibacter sp. KSP-S5-2]WNO07542.1 hypothetical protein P5V12_11120 [Teredinibacter sp. KSP-S5-2]
MVDSIKPTYRTIPSGSSVNRQAQAQGVESHTDERRAHSKTRPPFERRKKQDRRRESEYRPVYDMRQGRGRRKEDRDYHPTIETDA